MEGRLKALCEEARRHPEDARAQLDAAYACDRAGHEKEAVPFYDAAWRLTLPAEERQTFLIGYGSTLKNVGRLEDSERVLRVAIAEGAFPDAARAFLALTLHSAGRGDEAVAELLSLVRELAPESSGVSRHDRALEHYERVLRRR